MTEQTTERGQTRTDFLVGIAVFLSTMSFIVVFVPGMMAPYTGTNVGGNIMAEQASAELSSQLLAQDPSAGAEPTTLDAHCTKMFFKGVGTSNCPYQGGELTDTETIGVSGVQDDNINITMTHFNGTVVTHSGTELKRGGIPSEESSVSKSTRIVVLDQEPYQLTVKVW